MLLVALCGVGGFFSLLTRKRGTQTGERVRTHTFLGTRKGEENGERRDLVTESACTGGANQPSKDRLFVSL